MSALLAKLDEAAIALLTQAFPDKSKPPGESDIEAGPVSTLAERAKAFDTAMRWYKERMELNPPEKAKGRGEQLRERFQRQRAPRSRGSRSEAPPDGDSLETSDGTNGLDTDAAAAPN